MDAGKDAARSNGDVAEQLAELFIVADSELDVTGDDAALLVVASCIACKLKDFSSQVLEDSSEVHRGT